ncbi:MAG: glycosyl hydrolase family 18 protein, partial [Patescibacteria group bacterium]|nr:glycosyl hydrolase family 18 protein [Patescibacteria group bacterium]
MLKASFGNLLRPVLLFIIFVFILVALFVGIYKFITRNDYNTYINLKSPLPTPQISGWIPWWEEKRGYDLVKKYSAKINTVSPVWFMVDKNLKLIEVGRVDKKLAVTELKALNIKICPTLGSELSREEMSVFLNNKKATNELVKDLADEIVPLGVDGVDIDLEGMKKEDSDKFSSFLLLMSKRLKEKKLKMSVSVHAQTG